MIEDCVIVINGRMLAKRIEGISRYVYEILLEIDKDSRVSKHIIVVVPEGCDIKFHNLRIVQLSKCFLPGALMWDLIKANCYAMRVHANLHVNMAPGASWFRNSIVTNHDLREIVYDKLRFSLASMRTKFKSTVVIWLEKLLCNKIVTVSYVIEREINYFFKKQIVVDVIGNGWEHIEQRETDNSVFEKYQQIRVGGYYLAISSIAPHKNFKWIVENAKNNPDKQYVIVGGTNPKLWSSNEGDFKDNIIYLGFQSDEVLKALLVNAKALISPSLYEGFGIPPLEALACGTKVIVSDIPVYREIYGDAVVYLDPHDSSLDLDSVDWDKDRSGEIKRVLETYTWKNAAKKWIDLMERMSK